MTGFIDICIVSDIVLKHPKEFENLVPMMGGVHMAKAAMHCVGKFLKGCGIEDALVETKAFGLKVIESVLGGSNYVPITWFADCYRSSRIDEVGCLLDDTRSK